MVPRRFAACVLLTAALGVAGCGDDEPTAEEVRPNTVERQPLEAPPATTETQTVPAETTTTPAQTEPEGTGGATPTPPAATPPPAAPPATTPQGTGGVTPPEGESQEGGAGDADPSASPGGTPAP